MNAAEPRPPKQLTLFEEALCYAHTGFPVFPCAPGAKRPITARGFKDATTNKEQIRCWWLATPRANVGLAVPAPYFVLDLDLHKNRALLMELRARGVELPATSTAQTPSGGMHKWFRLPPGATVTQGASVVGVLGLDVRAPGMGYVIVEPSVFNKTRGRWLWREWLTHSRIADAPAALLALLCGAPAPGRTAVATRRSGDSKVLQFSGERRSGEPEIDPMAVLTEGVAEGSRNWTLFRACCALRREGAAEQTLRNYATAANARFRPPLHSREIESVIRSAMRYEPATASLSDDEGQP